MIFNLNLIFFVGIVRNRFVNSTTTRCLGIASDVGEFRGIATIILKIIGIPEGAFYQDVILAASRLFVAQFVNRVTEETNTKTNFQRVYSITVEVFQLKLQKK